MATFRAPALLPGLAAACLVAGCATHDPGWSGSEAAPHAAARAQCEAHAGSADSGPERDTLFEQCMARHGWTRGDD
ncbi:hypothetical protein GCM10028862_01230 [Luteimonas pelagia]